VCLSNERPPIYAEPNAPPSFDDKPPVRLKKGAALRADRRSQALHGI
jgi:hypothetical protein